MKALLVLAVAAGLASAGCLQNTHRVPRDELFALTQLPPDERGERVRVVQNLSTSPQPHERPPRTSSTTVVIIGGPIWVGGTPRHRHYRRPPPRTAGPRDHSAASRPPPGSSSGGGGGITSGRSNVAKGKKSAAKFWLVAAGVGAAALAFTEGARYDGWVRLHPMHPVHLVGPYGEWTWMPLAQLTPEAVSWSSSAYIRDNEGPWQELGRAPLNRQGFTYSLFFGGGEIAAIGLDPAVGFLSHLQFGYYPLHEFGIQFDMGFGWTDDDRGNTIFDGRYALELDAMPLAAGRFHAGAYGQIGGASRSDDGAQFDDSSGLLGAGAQMQLDITTRLALTGRAGLTWVHDEQLSELLLGLSIY